MPGDQKESPPGKGPGDGSKGRLLDWLDVTAKLVGAAAVLVVALIANSFQSRLTGVSIQSQREQAESQLRANMFSSLIGPIAGPQKDGKAISPDREQLLAELLALNFYENFELKPLLEDTSERLAPKTDLRRDTPTNDPDPREPLWSICRRIAERQKASIAREWETSKSSLREQGQWPGRFLSWGRPASQTCEFYTLTVEPKLPSPETTEAPVCQRAVAFGETVWLKSPDGNYTLQMAMVHPDWKNQTVKVSVWPFLSRQPRPFDTDTAYSFPLTWFDLPFTDNTLLPDGNRFAIYLRLISSEVGKLTVVVMWFPKGYFTPRERPLNYSEVQGLLQGRKPQ
jgi:hypothetical protein